MQTNLWLILFEQIVDFGAFFIYFFIDIMIHARGLNKELNEMCNLLGAFEWSNSKSEACLKQ